MEIIAVESLAMIESVDEDIWESIANGDLAVKLPDGSTWARFYPGGFPFETYRDHRGIKGTETEIHDLFVNIDKPESELVHPEENQRSRRSFSNF
jgi:hypothetical protein